jgi:high affinity choline transporter 7
MLGVDRAVTVAVSASVAVTYTLVGGMYAVAYTDVVQLVLTFFGLWLAIPFVVASPNVNLSELELVDWTGTVTSTTWVAYVDTFLMILCGGIPWQPYYQVGFIG